MCLSNTPFILLLLLFLGYLNFIFFSSFIAVGAFNFLMASIWCILLLLRVLLLLLLLPDSSSFDKAPDLLGGDHIHSDEIVEGIHNFDSKHA